MDGTTEFRWVILVTNKHKKSAHKNMQFHSVETQLSILQLGTRPFVHFSPCHWKRKRTKTSFLHKMNIKQSVNRKIICHANCFFFFHARNPTLYIVLEF